MGVSLHRYGTSAGRLEESLVALTDHLGMVGEFFSTPTYLAMAFNYKGEDNNSEQINRHIRVLPGETDLAKLQIIDQIANEIFHNNIELAEAIQKLEDIDSIKTTYPKILIILAYALVSFSLSTILKGGIVETSLATMLGMVVGITATFKKNSPKIKEVFEFLVSFLTVFGCYVAHGFGLDFNSQIVIVASIIVIVPGLDITIAMNELATKNLASGTARLMGALVDLAKLSFGIVIGAEVAKLIYPPLPILAATPSNQWFLVLAIVVASSAFTVIFNATKNDFPYILMSGVITYGVLHLSSLFFTTIISLLISAFAIGVVSNLFAKLKDRPAAIVQLPGIIYLVPGSIGLTGISHIFQKDIVTGLAAGTQMILFAITIVAALFMANIFVGPRRFL